MKRLKISSYLNRTKWFVVFFSVLVLVIFGRTVHAPELTKTAVVIGTGVDYSEESGKFSVTAQSVLLSAAASGDGQETTYVTYAAEGGTIAEALDTIGRKMGLSVSLAHCNVLFVSESVLKLDHLQLIYPLTAMYSLPEYCIMVTGEKSPKDMITVQIGTTTSAPYFLQLALSNKEGTNGMIRTNLKDFLARSTSKSEAVAIPYITYKKLENQPIGPDGEKKDNYEYNLEKTFVFNHTSGHIVDVSHAELLTLYLTGVTFGSLDFEADDGGRFEFRILEKGMSLSTDKKSVQAKLELIVEFLDVQFAGRDTVLTGADEEVLNAAKGLEKELTAKFNDLFDISKSTDIDFLGLKEKVYENMGRGYENVPLSDINFAPSVTIQVKETA